MSLPLYVKIKKDLKSKIHTLEDGDKLPTERSLSDKYGVDRITIRRALSDLEEEGFVVRKHGSGTFVLKSMPLEGDNSVTLLLPTLEIEYISKYAEYIEKELSKYKYKLQILDYDLDNQKEMEYLKILLDSDVSNILIIPCFTDSHNSEYIDTINELVAKDKKVLFLAQYAFGINAISVTCDMFDMAYRACEHLILLGYRNILLMSSDSYGDTTGISIKNGYIEALNDYNIKVNKDLIILEIPNKNSALPAKNAILDIYNKYHEEERLNKLPFNAVMSNSFSMVYGIINAFKEIDVKYPEDVYIFGADMYHNDELKDLPSMNLPVREMAKTAIEIMMNYDDYMLSRKRCYSIKANFNV